MQKNSGNKTSATRIDSEILFFQTFSEFSKSWTKFHAISRSSGLQKSETLLAHRVLKIIFTFDYSTNGSISTHFKPGHFFGPSRLDIWGIPHGIPPWGDPHGGTPMGHPPWGFLMRRPHGIPFNFVSSNSIPLTLLFCLRTPFSWAPSLVHRSVR